MAINIVRFSRMDGPRWGVALRNGVAPLAGEYPTTAALIEHGEDDWRARLATPLHRAGSDTNSLASDHAMPRLLPRRQLSPPHDRIRSGPGRQGLQHVLHKVGRVDQPADRRDVRPPDHVKLLDYEIELALVFRRAIPSPITVTPETLKDYVYAATIANDISARDVQLPQTQFFKGKSYRGFCPIGPRLTVLEPRNSRFWIGSICVSP